MPERLHVILRQHGPIPLDVAFDCGPGETVAIVGPSGSGKTTTLRSIAGLYAPTRCVVRVGDHLWGDSEQRVWVAPHRRHVGMVFQHPALFPHLTALGNVEIALTGGSRESRRARAFACLGQVHLGEKADRRPDALSGGERQRVALARALARSPAVLLLDEPFSAVDRQARRRLQDEVASVRDALGVPTVLVTHDLEDVVRLATHVLTLDAGRASTVETVATFMRRADLHGVQDVVGASTIADARVVGRLHNRGLAELTFGEGRLTVPDRGWPAGAALRLRIPAREVMLATNRPDGLSVQNVLEGEIAAVEATSAGDAVLVDVAVGGLTLAAEVTRDAVARLALAPGRPVFALVKAVSVEVVGPTREREGERDRIRA